MTHPVRRLEFGLGAAWAEVEHTMLGIPFYTVGQRIRRLGEACAVIRKLWTEETADFDGRYYTLTGAIANPKPLQRPTRRSGSAAAARS